MENGQINVRQEAGVSLIEFYHPQSNSFPSTLLAELSDCIKTEDKNPDTRILLISSRGDRAFCAGASFDELLSLEDSAGAKAFFMGFATLIHAIYWADKPVFGVIQGKTVGGGVGLASAFDYCSASEAASIRLSELSIGIGPFVIEPMVSFKIGRSACDALTYNPKEWRSAKWAEEKGLFHKLYENLDDLRSGSLSHAKEMANMSKEALKAYKRVRRASFDLSLSDLEQRAKLSGDLVLGKESKAILSAFKSKKQ